MKRYQELLSEVRKPKHNINSSCYIDDDFHHHLYGTINNVPFHMKHNGEEHGHEIDHDSVKTNLVADRKLTDDEHNTLSKHLIKQHKAYMKAVTDE